MTKEQINPRFLFVLEMYGAADRFVENFKEYLKNKSEAYVNNYITDINEEKYFSLFIGGSFKWSGTKEGSKYWQSIADQNEPEIFRLNEQMK